MEKIKVNDEESFVHFAESFVFDLQRHLRHKCKVDLEFQPMIEFASKLEDLIFHRALELNGMSDAMSVWSDSTAIIYYSELCEKLLRNVEYKELNWKKLYEDNKNNPIKILTVLLKDTIHTQKKPPTSIHSMLKKGQGPKSKAASIANQNEAKSQPAAKKQRRPRVQKGSLGSSVILGNNSRSSLKGKNSKNQASTLPSQSSFSSTTGDINTIDPLFPNFNNINDANGSFYSHDGFNYNPSFDNLDEAIIFDIDETDEFFPINEIINPIINPITTTASDMMDSSWTVNPNPNINTLNAFGDTSSNNANPESSWQNAREQQVLKQKIVQAQQQQVLAKHEELRINREKAFEHAGIAMSSTVQMQEVDDGEDEENVGMTEKEIIAERLAREREIERKKRAEESQTIFFSQANVINPNAINDSDDDDDFGGMDIGWS